MRKTGEKWSSIGNTFNEFIGPNCTRNRCACVIGTTNKSVAAVPYLWHIFFSHTPWHRGQGERLNFLKQLLGLYMLKKQSSESFYLAVSFVSFQCVGLHKSSAKHIVLCNILFLTFHAQISKIQCKTSIG